MKNYKKKYLKNDRMAVKIKLDKHQEETLETALKIAAHFVHAESAAYALELICSDFMASNAYPDELPLEKVLSHLERAYGVKLAVIQECNQLHVSK